LRIACRGQARHVVGQIGELVHDELRAERDDGLTDRRSVVDVADDRLGAERPERLDLPGRTSHPRDDMLPGDEKRHEPYAEHTARAREEDAHAYSVPSQRSQRTSSSASRRWEAATRAGSPAGREPGCRW
jgi:hypothetical protein